MKKIYFLFAMALFAFAAQAQYIYNDFDGNQNEEFLGWLNAPAVVANPDQTGINTSANVGEWIRSEEQWAHVYVILDGKIDFSTGETFSLKVWSPIACDVLFKLEDQANGATFVEVMQSLSTPEEWTQLTFDFAGASSGVYDKIVIFFDFSSTTDNTFYFDDVEGPEYDSSAPGNPVTLPVTFDDEEVNYALIDFGGTLSEIVVDPTNAENMVAKTIKTETAETWAGTTVGGTAGFPTPIPFAEGSTSMTVAVWSPTEGTPVRLKVEDSGDPTISVETEVNTTVAEEWETLTFDFSNEAPGTAELNLGYNYNKASIFFNFGTEGAAAGEQTYYWDDMEFAGGTGEKPLLALDVQDNFEDDGFATIPQWHFQDPELEALPVIVDPANANNHIADYLRSGNFEWTNAQFILDHRMDLTDKNIFEMKVFFPSSNDYSGDLTPTAALKLQNSLLGDDAWTTQTEIKHTVATYDEWVTLEFDFSIVSDRTDYDQVIVQFGGEGHFVSGQFHFDDIILKDESSSIFGAQISKLQISPNPAVDVIYITDYETLKHLEIYNITGQQIMQLNRVPQQISLSGLPDGLYTIKATGNNGELFTTKVIVQ
jgi:hypothetical protein